MEYNIPAKPTVYKNTEFRSRLEARWAAFFDLLGWRWQYEPYDLNGWTPDFIVYGSKNRYILFEVKPFLDDGLIEEYRIKIESSVSKMPDQVNCIILDNNFEEDHNYSGIKVGIQIAGRVNISSVRVFEFNEPFPVHWKDCQWGDGTAWDIGSTCYGYDGLLWNDEEHRKYFVEAGRDSQLIKSIWLQAGVLSSFHYA